MDSFGNAIQVQSSPYISSLLSAALKSADDDQIASILLKSPKIAIGGLNFSSPNSDEKHFRAQIQLPSRKGEWLVFSKADETLSDDSRYEVVIANKAMKRCSDTSTEVIKVAFKGNVVGICDVSVIANALNDDAEQSQLKRNAFFEIDNTSKQLCVEITRDQRRKVIAIAIVCGKRAVH